MNAVIGSFAATWLGYFVLLALLPIRYLSVEFADALVVLAIYVCLTVGCALLLLSMPKRADPPYRTRRIDQPLNRTELDHLVVAGLLASAVGVALLAYVRLAVQGIDYSQGLAVARELWRVEGVEREGISSPLSIPAYGLGFFFLASTFVAHLHWEELGRWARGVAVAGALFFVAAHSILTGGRTVLLIQISSFLAAASIRRDQGKKAFPGKSWRTVLFTSVTLVATFAYALLIFSERAAANVGATAELYVQGAIEYMGASTTEAYMNIGTWPQPLAGVVQLAILLGAYLTHSAGTLASVMEYTAHHGITVFGAAWNLLARLNLATPGADDWALSGAFLSLPGAFWYQFGMSGVLAAAVATGLCLGMAARYARLSRGGGISVGFAAGSLITAMTSPLIFGPDIMAFPFMILGYVGLAVYSRILFGARNWWIAGRLCQLARM